MNTERIDLRATKEEVKAEDFNPYLQINDQGIFRCHDVAAFEVDGIKSPEKPEPRRDCVALSPFWMLADSEPMHDAAENGTLLRIRMRDGRTVDRFITGSELESMKIWETLRAIGCRVKPHALARTTIKDYLLSNYAPGVVRTYGKSGWTAGPQNEQVFVLGNEVLGDTEGRFESVDNAPTACETSGTVEDWIERMAQPAAASPVWSFGICAAFAAPLMELVDFRADGGWHFYGLSSAGKSLVLECAASVFGPHKYLKSWNLTDGGVELIAETYNGLPLCLDELGEASSAVITRAVYALSDGQGRKRMDQKAKARRVRSWRLLTLSSGEVSIEDKIAERGKSLRGGQALRVADIYIDHKDLARDLPQAAQQLKTAQAETYGTVGREYLKRLVELRNEKPKELAKLKADFAGMLQTIRENIKDARRARAAQRFALVTLGAELAQSWGLLPESYDVRNIVRTVFSVWSTDTAKHTLNENFQAARRLLDFVETESGATIQHVNKSNELVGDIKGRRAGWIREPDEPREERPPTVYLLKTALDNAIGAYNLRAFVKAMSKAQVLKHSPSAFTHPTPRFEHQLFDRKSYPRTYQFDLDALRIYVDGPEPEETDTNTQTTKGANYGSIATISNTAH